MKKFPLCKDNSNKLTFYLKFSSIISGMTFQVMYRTEIKNQQIYHLYLECVNNDYRN